MSRYASVNASDISLQLLRLTHGRKYGAGNLFAVWPLLPSQFSSNEINICGSLYRYISNGLLQSFPTFKTVAGSSLDSPSTILLNSSSTCATFPGVIGACTDSPEGPVKVTVDRGVDASGLFGSFASAISGFKGSSPDVFQAFCMVSMVTA